MSKDKLIDEIINALCENGCIDIENYPSRACAFGECASVIEQVLNNYIIIKGELVE